MEVWKERTELLFGKGSVDRLASSCVAVVGVGGVGGYAAEMIVRSGVGKIIIIDSDNVEESNKNRQILALDSTVGRKKCSVLKERLLDINPNLEITSFEEYLTAENISVLLGDSHIDFLVDAIDTVSPKLALIQYCLTNGIPLVSAMGAGAKYDIEKVRIADISKSFNCPLAFVVRKRLRKAGIKRGFKVVFSEELPDRDAIISCDELNKKSNVGTISYLPAVFGCACAQVAILTLSGKGI